MKIQTKLFIALMTGLLTVYLGSALYQRHSNLLVIDDFGLPSVTGKQYRDLLEILDDRHGQGATLVTSQFPVSQWHSLINDATVADAILDRLVHNAYRIELKGESMRKGKTPPAEHEN